MSMYIFNAPPSPFPSHSWITCVFDSHPFLTSCTKQGTGCKCNCWRRDTLASAWCWVQERKVAAVTPGHCPMSGECITWPASSITEQQGCRCVCVSVRACTCMQGRKRLREMQSLCVGLNTPKGKSGKYYQHLLFIECQSPDRV